MDISLDDYIRQNFKKPSLKKERAEENASSKFDRYDREADISDDDGVDKIMDVSMEMPRLKPIEPRVQHQQRISVHERLGPRDSITNIDSAITIKVNNGPRRNRYKNLKRLNNQNDGRTSVQQRLNKNFVNPGIAARNNIINSWKLEKAVNAISDDEQHPIVARDFLTALTMRLMTTNPHKVEQIESKYNMNVQKEISEIQGKQMYYKCPGASVVSCDGPGLSTPLKVPHNETSMSLNQRFA